MGYARMKRSNSSAMRPIVILLIEDNPGDVELIQEGLKQGKVTNSLYVAHDGDDGLAFLRQEGVHADKPRPDIVVLDINLPKRNGHEVLSAIRSDPGLSAMPVIMLTTSNSDRDILRGYQNHVNAYITKPINAGDFLSAMRVIEDFWITLVKLPCTLPA